MVPRFERSNSVLLFQLFLQIQIKSSVGTCGKRGKQFQAVKVENTLQDERGRVDVRFVADGLTKLVKQMGSKLQMSNLKSVSILDEQKNI